ncbi:rare lipoprotein A [Desulfosudis oleivorans Hxd3]|uniref:Probable endolytic peptidoglycan transglycosylase RlpA n=1 Tax=Desulfosudis oleivorans (strain DSM 6200 / JCM 39069 / Hxd3) TaxID=96561 RepID=A8ZX99_DESOH|nr:rare lipoprotein A [Desulfosudis oleivorans Hxd3]
MSNVFSRFRPHGSRYHCFLPWGFLLVCLLMSGCATRVVSTPPAKPSTGTYRQFGKEYRLLPSAAGFTEEGMASWYGEPFHGRKTASGEVYDMHKPSAAHKTLPLGTRVTVYNKQNGKSLEVRINDRGPFVAGRVIDLSYAAARELGVIGPGTAPVRITALEPHPGDVRLGKEEGVFAFQVGAFASRQNADNFQASLLKRFAHVHVTEFFDGVDTFHRVRVGRYPSREAAEAARSQMAAAGFEDAFIVAE